LDFEYAVGAKVEIGEADFLTKVTVNLIDKSGFDHAIETARNADKVVIVLGELAYQSGEGRSRAHPEFPGLQQELLEAVQAASPNTVLVVMSRRPLALTWAEQNVPSIIQAWHLGHESGRAVTNALTGVVNPSGKLPMTFPRSVGQIPIYYNHLNTGRPGPSEFVFWSHYADESNAPLFPFGRGLSFTEFEYSNLRAQNTNKGVEILVRVRNTGDRDGSEVVQLYIHDRVASVSRPERELKGFQKIALRAGEEKTVSFILTGSELGFHDSQGTFVVEPGEFDVYVGDSSLAEKTVRFAF
jgi:beta-glucosidase